MDVSVIIVNYRSNLLLYNCVRSVVKKTEGLEYEIIVVDNAPKESVREVLTGDFTCVKLIENSENIGFGRANNEGLKIAKGRNVLFLNPDIELQNNSLKILSDYLDNHPPVGIAGGNLYTGSLSPAHSYAMLLPSPFTEFDTFTYKLLSKMRWGANAEFNTTGEPLKVGYITGADMMVKRSILDKTGGFDPSFFLYYEETELTHRIKKAGYDVINIPEAQMKHFEGQSFISDPVREEYFQQGRKIYFDKTSGSFRHKMANFWFTLTILTRKSLFWLVRSENYAYWKVRGEIFKKLYRK